MKNYCIYGLIDPRKPDHVKYVGQTVKVLKRRLQIHVAETLRHSREEGRKLTYKENWILSLLNENVNPEAILIEEIDSLEQLDERELFWIAHYRNIGQAECNFKDGGAFSIRNLKEMWARKNKENGLKTADEKKAELLAMSEDSPRPKKSENLGLNDYTTITKDGYDPIFDKAIRTKFPHWFNHTRIAANKEKLLSLSLTSLRPTQGMDFGLSDYIKPNGNVYDPVFDKTIREKFPHWFDGSKRITNGFAQIKNLTNHDNTGKKEKMAELLALPDDAKRPHAKTKLGSALCDYTGKTKDTFDPEFNTAIRAKFPHWFIEDRVAANMQTLLNMPVGSPKPRKDDPLGNALRMYTRIGNKSYRLDFDQAIRNRHPTWFRGKWYSNEIL